MNRTLSAAICVTLVACTACSSPSEPSDPLLASADAARAADAYASLNSRDVLLAPATPAVGDPGAFACPYGGSHRTSVGPSGSSPFRLAFVLKGCVLADSTGQRWTFTTLPQLDIAATFASTDSTNTNVNIVTGTMRVESGTVRGTCRIDVRRESVMNYSARTIRSSQSGTYCGQSVDATWSASFPAN